jgi:hypothetical protein
MEKDMIVKEKKANQIHDKEKNLQRFDLITNKKFTEEEVSYEKKIQIMELHQKLGNRWKMISSYFEDTNDNFIKNQFFSLIRKSLRNARKIIGMYSNTEFINNIYPKVLSRFVREKIIFEYEEEAPLETFCNNHTSEFQKFEDKIFSKTFPEIDKTINNFLKSYENKDEVKIENSVPNEHAFFSYEILVHKTHNDFEKQNLFTHIKNLEDLKSTESSRKNRILNYKDDLKRNEIKIQNIRNKKKVIIVVYEFIKKYSNDVLEFNQITERDIYIIQKCLERLENLNNQYLTKKNKKIKKSSDFIVLRNSLKRLQKEKIQKEEVFNWKKFFELKKEKNDLEKKFYEELRFLRNFNDIEEKKKLILLLYEIGQKYLEFANLIELIDTKEYKLNFMKKESFFKFKTVQENFTLESINSDLNKPKVLKIKFDLN